MKAVFDTYLHLNGFVRETSLLYRVVHNKFFFLSDSIVVTVDNHVHIVSKTNNDTIVALKLFLYTIEGEGILARICQHARWLKLLPKVDKVRGLILVEQILNHSDQLDTDPEMINLRFTFKHLNLDLSLDIVSILNL
jgi:hypothetical protein